MWAQLLLYYLVLYFYCILLLLEFSTLAALLFSILIAPLGWIKFF